MTAVASPPSVQPLPRWNNSNGADGLDSMSAEEVSRMFMPRKSAQRQNSSSSVASSSDPSPAFTIPVPAPQSNGDGAATNGDQGGWGPRKKNPRGPWSLSKADPVTGLSTARPPASANPSSGQSAALTMNSAIHQNPSVLPSQSRAQAQQQQNGGRQEQSTHQQDASAILALLPLTGTFERKQIIVPFSPELLRIGRQTNAKTMPTSVNGFFDSKVLSRQHAEVWADRSGKIWIRDVKSSNGTFINGVRLSQENRESEPHELREQDTLELGIDIVSEDQKSIVHHKVSAKVELAGIYSNSPTLLEMMQVDPNTGHQVLGETSNQQLSQMRGRGGNQGTLGNGRFSGPPSLTGGHANVMGPQRQMNIWMGPITIEQVVNKLHTELKQAKQQADDLHQTENFFGTLLALEPGEEPPKSPQKLAAEEKQANGIPPPVQPEPTSPFSQPPAPPPQQPLPQKPDMAKFSVTDSLSQSCLRRTEAEKSRAAINSPPRLEPQNGQIVSLIEALKSAKQEIDLQGDRMKYLEVALERERKARETAERRALALAGGLRSRTVPAENGTVEEDDFEPPLDSLELIEQGLPNGHVEKGPENEPLLRSSASFETIKNPEEMHRETEAIDASTSRLQARLDLMVQEMDEMKSTMESYKRRAEDAEEGRRSLAEMVENIRAKNESVLPTATGNSNESTLVWNDSSNGFASSKDPSTQSGDNHGLWKAEQHRSVQNGNTAAGNMQRELEKTLSNVLQQQTRHPGEAGRMAQSAPYVSMVGVVLIGVGLMTWLNGWQPGGDK